MIGIVKGEQFCLTDFRGDVADGISVIACADCVGLAERTLYGGNNYSSSTFEKIL